MIVLPLTFLFFGLIAYAAALHMVLNGVWASKAARSDKLISARIASVREKTISSGGRGRFRKLFYATVSADVPIRREVQIAGRYRTGSRLLIFRNHFGLPCEYQSGALRKNSVAVAGVFGMGTLCMVVALLLKIGIDNGVVGPS